MSTKSIVDTNEDMDSSFQNLSPQAFSELVENKVREHGDNDYGYLEAITDVLSDVQIEPEQARSVMSLTLIAKLEAECDTRGLLKEKSSTKSLSNFFASK